MKRKLAYDSTYVSYTVKYLLNTSHEMIQWTLVEPSFYIKTVEIVMIT